ncbi:MAG: hypothetical protein ACAI35_11775 [Candidatus Methylacidiphilales bacterium]|nr:hypothetical protein [Candidatus Methylacidiphilales bacterium]
MPKSPRFFFTIRLLYILSVLGLMTLPAAVFAGECKGISQKKFDKYLADAIRGDRVDTAPYGAVIEGDSTYNLRKALFDLEKSSDWAKFNYEQRREFTFQILVHTHLNTGSSTLLLYMLGMDARPIAKELALVSNTELARHHNLTASEIKWYRGNLRLFKGDVTLDYRPTTMEEYQ